MQKGSREVTSNDQRTKQTDSGVIQGLTQDLNLGDAG